MNTTISSYALALCCAALLATGCTGSNTEADTDAAATPNPEENPIAAEGFESGEAQIGDPDAAAEGAEGADAESGSAESDDDGEDGASDDDSTAEDA